MDKTLVTYEETLDGFKQYCTDKLTNVPQDCQFYTKGKRYVCVLPDGSKIRFVYNLISSTYSKMLVPYNIQIILKQVRSKFKPYTYHLVGINKQRPRYGISTDIKKLEKWAKLQGADFLIKGYCYEPNNYYVLFEMTDPVVQDLENEGFLN